MQGDCPDQWTSLAGGCYKFLPDKLNWEDAKAACEDLHGWIVEIGSQECNDALHKEAKSQGFDSVWIGLNDLETEGEFLLGSGKAPSYTNWAKDQPRNYKDKAHPDGEDCARLNIKGGSADWAKAKKWNDVFCDRVENVICQYDRKLYEKGTNKTVFMQGLGWGGLKLICQFKASMMTPTVIIFNFAMITIMITTVMMMMIK